MTDLIPLPTLLDLPAQWNDTIVRPSAPVSLDALDLPVRAPDGCRWCGSARVTAVAADVGTTGTVLLAVRCEPCGLTAVYEYRGPDEHDFREACWECGCDCWM